MQRKVSRDPVRDGPPPNLAASPFPCLANGSRRATALHTERCTTKPTQTCAPVLLFLPEETFTALLLTLPPASYPAASAPSQRGSRPTMWENVMFVSRTTRIMSPAAAGLHAVPSAPPESPCRSLPSKVDRGRLLWQFSRTSEATPAPDHVPVPGGHIARLKGLSLALWLRLRLSVLPEARSSTRSWPFPFVDAISVRYKPVNRKRACKDHSDESRIW